MTESTHTIHGRSVRINVVGNIGEDGRGKCIGKVVNVCREMDRDTFDVAIRDLTDNPRHPGQAGYGLLAYLDSKLAENFSPRYVDDCQPTAELKLVE